MEAGGKATGLSPWQLGHAQVTRAWPIRRARVRSGLWTREAGLGLSRKAAVLLSGGSGRTSWWQGQGMWKDAGFPTHFHFHVLQRSFIFNVTIEEKWFKTEMEKSIATPCHTYLRTGQQFEQFEEPEG